MENKSMAVRRILSGFFLVVGICGMLLFLWIVMTGIYKGKSLLGTTKTVAGKVAEVSEAGAFDAVFHLENCEETFYINRGLQYYGFTLDGLRQLTRGRSVSISYVAQRSAFPAERQSSHINKLVVADSVVFDEMEGIPAYK
ncbi:MAG: hypothetical protein K0R82_250 [Flavipsychrobacter sp.]|jgi:hypothetical protein|nr:hypothetical protein [Flavipsychrobacter sp.]